MSTTRRGSGWYTSFMVTGQRFIATFESKEAGELWEAEVRSAIQAGRPIPSSHTQLTRNTRVETIGELHRVVARDKWSDKKSGLKLTQNGQMFVDWAKPDLKIKYVTSQMLYDYVDYLRSTGNSNATINRKISAIKVMLRWAERNNIIDKVPYVEKFKELSAGAASDFFDFGEENAVVELLHHRGYHRIAAFFLFSLDTGCRVHEGLRLEYSAVNNQRVNFSYTKSGNWRVVPLTNRAQQMINRSRNEGSHPSKPFGDLSYRQTVDTLRAIYDALGGRYANIKQPMHILRHSCASRLAIRGVDAKRIMDWMGHSNISVTQRYMKLSPTALDDAAATLEPQAPTLKVVNE